MAGFPMRFPVDGDGPQTMTAELAVVVPTFNEKANVEPLVDLLDKALKGIEWEVIFVDDDSQDGTGAAIRSLAARDPRVRCLRRIGRRGLSSACIEGMMATSAPYIAVMDADLQHDQTLLPKMLSALKEGEADVVVGSRYVAGGDTVGWSTARRWISRLATGFGRFMAGRTLSDPMSGFFMLRRDFLELVVRRLTGKGFKILLDISLSSTCGVRFLELPYSFRPRRAGESKLDALVVRDYFELIADKLLGRFVPVRFLMFVVVGCVGAMAHIAVLGVLLKGMNFDFTVAQASAILIAMTVNFVLNNLFSYRDQKLHGRMFMRGLLTFYMACSIGAFINLRVALFLFESGIPWWFSGVLGAAIGAVWNYAVTSYFTWRA
jgi:dolichol-phosphate mannosyltransferase